MRNLKTLLLALLLMVAESGFLTSSGWGQYPADPQRLYDEAKRLSATAQTINDMQKAIRYFEIVMSYCANNRDRRGVAVTSCDLGVVYSNMGRYTEAKSYFLRSIAIAREIGDTRVESVAKSNLGAVYFQLGEYSQAEKYLLVSLEESRRSGKRESQVANLSNLGAVYINLGQYDKAERYLKEALEIAKQIGNTKGIQEVMKNLGTLSSYRGKQASSLEYQLQALNSARSLGDRRAEGQILNEVGAIHHRRGQYVEALTYYEQSLRIAKDLNDRDGISRALHNLGAVYKARGRYAEAVNSFESCLNLARQMGDRRAEAHELNALGAVYGNWCRWDEAINYLQQAKSIFEAIGDTRSQAEILASIAVIHEHKDECEEAVTKLRQAIDICERIGAPTRSMKDSLASLFLDMENLQKAESLINDRSNRAVAGRFYLTKADYPRAKACYEALYSSSKNQSEVDAAFIACTGLGAVYEAKGEYLQAIKFYREAVDLTEQLRSSLTKDQRANFLGLRVGGFMRTTPYKGLSRLLQKTGDVREAFKISEYTKARGFADYFSRRLETGTGTSHNGPEPKDLREEIADQEAVAKRELRAAYEKGDQEAIKVASDRVNELEKKRSAYADQLRQKFPLFAAAKYPTPMDISEASLKENEWVLAYDVTDSGTIIYLLKGREVVESTFSPILRKDLDNLITRFREPLENVTGSNVEAKLKAFDFKAAHKLSDVLLKDLLARVPPGEPVIVIPDDSLGLVPFEALVLNEGGLISDWKPFPQLTGADFFGDRNAISYYHSATALTLTRRYTNPTGSGSSRLLVMADPVFQSGDQRAHLVKEDCPKLSASEAELYKNLAFMITVEEEGGGGRPKFKRLSGTGELAKALKSMYGGQADVYTGLEANKQNFIQQVAPKLTSYSEIVFATHGDFSKSLPGMPEPFLALSTVPPGTDGFLRLSDVMRLKMKAQIVALTACKSGMGSRVSGEGTMSMGRAFQYAGTQSVLMSLWSVEQTASVKLAESFFHHVKDGNTKLEAIKQARLEIRQAGYDHPFFWASFILMGEAGASRTFTTKGVHEDASSVQPASVDGTERTSGSDLENGKSLLEACKSGKSREVARLLEKGASVRARDPEFEGTPLHWAVYGGHTKVVAMLLKNGADINALNKDGRTPLSFAASLGHADIVKLLIRKGANTHLKDKDGLTAADWASAKGNRAIAKTLRGR